MRKVFGRPDFLVTAGSVLIFLVICALIPTPGYAASIRSFRAGLQPGGARLVIDLDEPADYGVRADASTIRVVIGAGSAGPASGRFPKNPVAVAYASKPSEKGTSLEITLNSTLVAVRHYTLSRPERIVLDMAPSPGSAEPEGENPQVDAIHGLVRSQFTTGPGKGYTDLRLSPEDLPLVGGLAAKTYPFEIPVTRRIVEGGSFSPVIRFLGPGRRDQARLIFILNGVPLGEALLESEAPGGPVAAIDLPASLLRPGTNRLTLAAATRQKEGIKDGGGTLRILNGSNLRLRYRTAPGLSLKDMVSLLEDDPAFSADDLAVIIPDRPEPEEVQAALELLLEWYGKSPRGAASARVLTQDLVNGEVASSSPMIYLGRRSLLSRPVLEAFRWDTTPPEGSFLSCFMDTHGKFRFLITSETAKGVLSGAMALLDPELRGRFDAEWIFVSPDKPLPGRRVKTRSDKIPFKDLAGGDLVFSGPGKRTRRVELLAPPAALVGGRAELTLAYSFSPFIDGEGSSLTLILNGTPAATAKLDGSTGEKGLLTATIPKALLDGNPLEVAIEADLEPSGGGKGLPGEAFWMVVDGSSHARIPLAAGQLPPLLEYFPYQVGKGEVTVFVGSPTARGLLSTLGAILSESQRVSATELRFNVRPLEELRWENLKGDAVIAARLEELFTRGIPLAALRRGDEVEITGGRKNEATLDVDRDAFFQILPRKGVGTVLVVGWPRNGLGEPFPAEGFRLGELKGDACLVSDGGRISPLYLSVPEPRGGSGGRIPLGVAALVLSLALLWILVFLSRDGNRR